MRTDAGRRDELTVDPGPAVYHDSAAEEQTSPNHKYHQLFFLHANTVMKHRAKMVHHISILSFQEANLAHTS